MLKVYISMALGVLLTVLVALLGKYHSEHPAIQPRPETLEGLLKIIRL